MKDRKSLSFVDHLPENTQRAVQDFFEKQDLLVSKGSIEEETLGLVCKVKADLSYDRDLRRLTDRDRAWYEQALREATLGLGIGLRLYVLPSAYLAGYADSMDFSSAFADLLDYIEVVGPGRRARVFKNLTPFGKPEGSDLIVTTEGRQHVLLEGFNGSY